MSVSVSVSKSGLTLAPMLALVHTIQVKCSFREVDGLRVVIDRVVYVPTLEAPPDRPYPFVYFITIDNQSAETVTIRGRKWVVTDITGQQIVVEGDGVVGEFPRLSPGEQFSYNSYHVIGTNSVADGAFLGVSENGDPFVVRIPRFEMKVPE